MCNKYSNNHKNTGNNVNIESRKKYIGKTNIG
jgi:hypothetical protein